MTAGAATRRPFTVDRMLEIPRLAGLWLAPDGRRLVTSVSQPSPDAKKFVSALWEIDPAGERAPRRLTRSAPGESGCAFLQDGSILFISSRPDPERPEDEKDDEETGALWLLPAGGGEARVVSAPPGGVDGVTAARASNTVVVAASVHPRVEGFKADAEREKARKKVGASGVLFESYPLRWWDHYLGPRERHLFAGEAPDEPEGRMPEPSDVTPDAGIALVVEEDFDVSADGSTIVTGWTRTDELPRIVSELVAIDRRSAARRTLATDAWYSEPAISPDGGRVVCVRNDLGAPDRPFDATLWLIDLETGDGHDATPDLDLVPHAPRWSLDGTAIFFVADRAGHTAAFRLDVEDGSVTLLAAEGAFSDLCPSPDGATVFALRSTVTDPPRPVALDARASEQRPRALRSPVADPSDLGVPGTVERITTRAVDGTEIGSWLVLPPDDVRDGPAPLVLWVHGGPFGSWNSWHWRWNPHVLAERGYAVLLPDPALSTGYGRAMIARAWGAWGDTPFADLMAATDAALERPDLDRERTAAMGGSYGGYMANWIAGRTDRFRAIITHASIWDLRGFHGTTDLGVEMEYEFGDPYRDERAFAASSPHRGLAAIRTPMLVIHGERDHRVPIGEALRLWTDLRRRGVESKFLYFPDENHWILKPPNSRTWYETVLAFLDHHVRGQEWRRPELL